MFIQDHSTYSHDKPNSHFLTYFFFNDTATTEIYTLSLHDALPICTDANCAAVNAAHKAGIVVCVASGNDDPGLVRSEEHTSELQSLAYLVCRLLLEKKNNKQFTNIARWCNRCNRSKHM